MATFNVLSAPDMTSNTTFRAWSKSLFDTIIAGGWIQTSDTNQINFTTVTKPSVINTMSGYVMLRMNDTLQGTAPCYLKIEFGAGPSVTYPSIAVSIGTGTDGAGNLTGKVSGRYQIYNSASSTSQINSKYSISNNRLVICLWVGLHNWCVCVERFHDSSGADTAAGCMIFAGAQSNYGSSSIIPGYTTSSYTYWNCSPPATGSTAAFGADVFLTPIRTWGTGETPPSNQIMSYFTTDLTVYNTLPIKMWDGVTRPMFCFPQASNTFVFNGGVCSLAMRFD
jgi:hypothetical protein